MTNYLYSIGIFILVLLGQSCTRSQEVGGISWGQWNGKLGRDFVDSTQIPHFSDPKEKIIFKITHSNIDLSNYDILLDDEVSSRDHYYYYYGPYQKEIPVYKAPTENRKDFIAHLVIRIIDKKTDSLYYFTSDVQYYIFDTNKPIKIKLYSDEFNISSDLHANYRLKGCPSTLDL